MPDSGRRGLRFYCPGCDEYVGGVEFGPISGSWFCDGCVAEGKDVAAKKTAKKKS